MLNLVLLSKMTAYGQGYWASHSRSKSKATVLACLLLYGTSLIQQVAVSIMESAQIECGLPAAHWNDHGPKRLACTICHGMVVVLLAIGKWPYLAVKRLD